MLNERGIVLLAAKHPYYGRMAYNLAVTLKAADDKDDRIPVAVVHSGRGLKHLSEQQLQIFDDIIEVPDSDDETIGLKLMMYDYSPFHKTLYVDADNVWLPKKKPLQLMCNLEGVPFTAITEGFYDLDEGRHEIRPDYYHWASPSKMVEAYDLTSGRIYQWRSEVMYFERSDAVEEMFTLAREIYLDPKIEVQQFAGTVPDEVCLNIAANKLGIHPHQYKWQPCYWDKIHGGRFLPLPHIMNQYWIMSTGGNQVTPSLKKAYNQIVGAACYKLKVQNLFLLQPKKYILAERAKF